MTTTTLAQAGFSCELKPSRHLANRIVFCNDCRVKSNALGVIFWNFGLLSLWIAELDASAVPLANRRTRLVALK